MPYLAQACIPITILGLLGLPVGEMFTFVQAL